MAELLAESTTGCVIAAAITVHRELGPGLLESTYEACLAEELLRQGVEFQRQKQLPITYRGKVLPHAYRVDLFVAGVLIVELKSIERFDPVHTAQMLTYLKLTGCPVGLLINFNVPLLKQGLRRIVLSAEIEAQPPQAVLRALRALRGEPGT